MKYQEGVVTHDESREFRRDLLKAFSGYRAEWLGAEIFRLFTEPAYFPQLTTSRPCFLVGGRGTGKTTALRCLSYEGQFALYQGESAAGSGELEFVGMYLRINTNRVRAFGGPELSDALWLKLFGHYINIELAELVLRFLAWYAGRHPDRSTIQEAALRKFGISLHLGLLTDLDSALNDLELARPAIRSDDQQRRRYKTASAFVIECTYRRLACRGKETSAVSNDIILLSDR